MAKISVEIDTDGKTMVVKIDGKEIENVTDFSASLERNSNGNVNRIYSSIRTSTVEDNGVEKLVSYYAQASQEAQDAINHGVAVYNDCMPGYVGVPVSDKVKRDIEKFFDQMRTV